MSRWRFALAVAAGVVLAAAIALAVSGGTEPSPDERFAESVCAIQLATLDQILDVLDQAVHTRATPGEEGWTNLAAHAYQAQTIARKYRRDLQAIDVPDTDAGHRVARYMEDFARYPLGVTSEAVRRINGVTPKDMTLIENIRGLNEFQSNLDFVRAEMVDGGFLKHPNVVPELLDEFQNADSCEKIGEGMREDERA